MVSVLVSLIFAGTAVIITYLLIFQRQNDFSRSKAALKRAYQQGYHQGYLAGYTDHQINQVDERFEDDVDEELDEWEDDQYDPSEEFEGITTAWHENLEESGEAEKQRKGLERVIGKDLYARLGLKK